jgi:hypothetical protein
MVLSSINTYVIMNTNVIGGPMAQALDRVLKAYAFFRPDIGYVQVPFDI